MAGTFRFFAEFQSNRALLIVNLRKNIVQDAHSLTLHLCLSCCLVLATIFVQAPSVMAQENAQQEKIGVVLTNLPPRGSAKYQYLLDVSGAVGGEELPMSRAEMWVVDQSRTEMLKHVCDEQGVQITEIHEGFNKLMTVMPEAQTGGAILQQARQSKIVDSIAVAKLNPSGIVEYALGRGKKPMIGNQRAPQSARDEIEIPLSASQTITAKRVNVYTTQSGCYWHGTVGDSELPVNLMWWPDGRMAGSFTYAGKYYVIRNIEGDTHAIMALDPEKMPDEHPAMPAEFRERFMTPGDGTHLQRAPVENLQNLQDAKEDNEKLPEEILKLLEPLTKPASSAAGKGEPVEISVLFAYTKKAASHYTNVQNDVIALAVEQTTQSFRNSKIDNIKIKVVGSYLTDYDEGEGNLFNHLWRFADRGDGHLEDVHKIRDEKKADIAFLIVDNPTGCGLATRVAAFENEAFAVVNHECATTTFSVAHEIGHLIGARHDRSLDQSTQPFPYGHGFANQTKWRTMMAYKSSCDGCARLPVWSSPAVEIKSERAGDPMTDNARVIAEQAARVAAFR